MLRGILSLEYVGYIWILFWGVNPYFVSTLVERWEMGTN